MGVAKSIVMRMRNKGGHSKEFHVVVRVNKSDCARIANWRVFSATVLELWLQDLFRRETKVGRELFIKMSGICGCRCHDLRGRSGREDD